jgi:lysophospholipase L1-like esterase
VGQPTPAAQQALAGFNNQTIRMIVPVSAGGRRVRVQFSNAFGTAPLVIGAAHVGIHAAESSIAAGSDRALTFGGRPGFTIPAGAVAVSDGVELEVAAVSELAVSVFVPSATGAPTVHSLGLHSTYISKQGDLTGQISIADAAVTQSWYWLSSVDVLTPNDTNAIVAFGDSITDGARSTLDTNASWPSVLARRLSVGGATLAVINEGIAGNRLLRDTVGLNALARLDEDVLGRAGVKWLIVLEGINDIGRGTGPGANPADAVTADEVISALQQVIERAHVHGIAVIGATILPYAGAAYFSEKGEAIRQAVNRWIRTSGAFNGVIDFEAATRDANNPKALRAELDSGDHLHPNDAGYKAMADAIDLSLFGAKPAPASASAR